MKLCVRLPVKTEVLGQTILTSRVLFRLLQCDYGGMYTIKKYHSNKVDTNEGWQHTKIELIPLNEDYETIDLNSETEYRTVGLLKCVL